MTDRKTVALFIPCLVDQVFPEIGMAMARVLESLGYVVSYNAEQVCCGQPAFNAGQLDESRKVAEHFCSCFEPGEIIVCPSGSCVSMVRNHYQTLFVDQPSSQKAMDIGKTVFEFSEFLFMEGRVDDLKGRFDAKVAFHCSCHSLRELGLSSEITFSILDRIAGLDYVQPDDPHKCCGFGGLFYLKYPTISDAMTEQRLDQLLMPGVDLILSNDPGCIMVLRRMLGQMNRDIKVLHLAELLDQSLHR